MTELFLYKPVDKLYHSVMDHMPEPIQRKEKTSAFLLGGAGITAVVKGLQKLAETNLINFVMTDFNEKYLPVLEGMCIAGITGVPLWYMTTHPTEFKRILRDHPVYSAGMIGVYVGSVGTALVDLING
ncbi:hypothetical protein HQ529_02150 [Candidatus Woesearchaeota archaeon]|nr:hypothetical protein [Candidatus Woesearchaeota archaeon]